jgi:hypothetical protein
METFAPRTARAQAAAAAAKKRYLALYFPNGTADFWHPTGAGAGDAWKLSPILEPLAALKSQLTVMQNVGYQDQLRKANPSHSQLGAAMWTCMVCDANPNVARNGTSVDQIIAKAIGGATALPSLQVGLSTLDSYADGRHPANSRSISWASPTEPLYKIVNPQAVFDRLIAGVNPGNNTPTPDPAAARRRALNKSALDYILESTGSLQPKLSVSDRARMDQFLTSVRALEKRVSDGAMQVGTPAVCKPVARPAETYGVGNTPMGYNRDVHANIMIDLVVMAFQCDITRVVSFMLDDARSDFAYTFLKERKFTAAGSTPATTGVSDGNIASGLAGFHGLQHAGSANNGFATINHWLSEKAALLAGKLAAIPEGAGGSVLDNSVVVYGSGMHGGNHEGIDIPIALIGGGGGTLKKDHFFPWPQGQLLANVHLTIMQKVFGLDVPSFGPSTGIIPDILA